MVVVFPGGAQDARARHILAVVREVVLALTGVALADLVYVAVLAVGRTLYNHIQHSTSNPSASSTYLSSISTEHSFHILRLFSYPRTQSQNAASSLNLNELPTTSIWRQQEIKRTLH